MNILLIGSGGREHAIAASIVKSKLVNKLYCIPGNPGIQEIAEIENISIDNHTELIKFINLRKINLVLCGPEIPLAKGLMDDIKQAIPNPELILIGPDREGAQLESSKSFAKAFMSRHNIPTARYKSFEGRYLDDAIDWIETLTPPIVLKADGLAAGKGVIISPDHFDAIEQVQEMFEGKFGEASKEVVIEEFLKGIEFSIFALTNGEQYILLPEAKDYKRIGEGDTGLNTGGMGAISPVPFVDKILLEKVKNKIIEPTIQGLKSEGISYQGFLFFGLINVEGEPYVIEYNCRMGDPETEAVFPRIESDIVELMIACHNKTLDQYKIEINSKTVATIMLVSGGYPEDFEKGKKIEIAENNQDSLLFHAGTKVESATLVTNGGRVMAISSFGENLEDAVNKSKVVAEKIHYDGKYYRHDIGFDLKG